MLRFRVSAMRQSLAVSLPENASLHREYFFSGRYWGSNPPYTVEGWVEKRDALDQHHSHLVDISYQLVYSLTHDLLTCREVTLAH